MKLLIYLTVLIFQMEYIFATPEIDNFLTPPYQEMNFNDVDNGKIYFYFTENINSSYFYSIYLTNSSKTATLYSNTSTSTSSNLCTFYSKLVRCIVPHKELYADNNNKNHKFYYKLKYKLDNTNNEYSGLVTVAVNNGNFLKVFALVALVLLF